MKGNRYDLSEFQTPETEKAVDIYKNDLLKDYKYKTEKNSFNLLLMELGNKAIQRDGILNKKVKIKYFLKNSQKVNAFLGSFKTDPVEISSNESIKRALKEQAFEKYYQEFFLQDCRDSDETNSFNSSWIHLKLGMAIFLDKLMKDKLISECPIFDPRWDLSLVGQDSFIIPMDNEALEFTLNLSPFKYLKKFQCYRIQNFFMSFFFNSLFYYYETEHREMLKESPSETFIIHLKYKDSIDDLSQLAELEDLSYLLLYLIDQEIKPYKPHSYDGDQKGAAMLLERLNVPQDQ